MKSMLILTAILLLLLTTSVLAMNPPAIEWERLYGTVLFDVHETEEGNYIIGALDSVFLTDSNGDILWYVSSYSIGWFYSKFEFVLLLSDGDFIASGVGKEFETSSYSIPVIRISSTGNVLWSQNYGYNEFTEYAYDAVELPDGGLALAARKGAQAWILRTDAMGDTLWTREWGWVYNDKAMTVLYIDNGLTVLMHGSTETTEGGPHLVRYDLDGNFLWETALEYSFPGSYLFAQEMCRASDGGLLFLDNYHPKIAHFDILGNFDWYFQPPGNGENYGWSVSTTMDGGILYSGENSAIGLDGSKDDRSGMISRHDYQGNELWRDYVYNSGCRILYSSCQLSQGGYIAAGKAFSSTDGYQGYLIKYAPELGFESQESSPSLEITSISPNPFSAVTEIQFSLVEAGEASLTVFDLNGRVVDVLGDDLFSEGEHALQWAPEGIASGCYLVRLTSVDHSVIGNMVFIK